MLTEYINSALENAHYEIIEDDKTFWGEIPELKGVWARGETLEECRNVLREALEEWIIFRLKRNLEIPVIKEISPGFLKRLLRQAGVTAEEWEKEE